MCQVQDSEIIFAMDIIQSSRRRTRYWFVKVQTWQLGKTEASPNITLLCTHLNLQKKIYKNILMSAFFFFFLFFLLGSRQAQTYHSHKQTYPCKKITKLFKVWQPSPWFFVAWITWKLQKGLFCWFLPHMIDNLEQRPAKSKCLKFCPFNKSELPIVKPSIRFQD